MKAAHKGSANEALPLGGAGGGFYLIFKEPIQLLHGSVELLYGDLIVADGFHSRVINVE